jgi:pilus assembly protein CpaB
MKKVVLFALIAALCAGALLYVYFGKLEQQKQVQIVYEEVVVAAKDIPAYTTIAPDMVTIKQMPLGSAHPQAARTVDEAIGYVTESDILAGEEILPGKLKQIGKTDSGMSYIVPAGMRAITVGVDEISGVAGFIQRGDYVDVLAFVSVVVISNQNPTADQAAAGEDTTTQTTEPTETTESAALVVAQNICVAAIGTSLANTSVSPQEGGVGYGSVTLLVTPEDALRIVQSAKSGSIMLVLRASGDHERNTEDPILSNQLLEKAK